VLFFSEDHSNKVNQLMVDILHPLLTESDTISFELLDTILLHIVEPAKSSKKHAYNLAKILITKSADALEQYIQSFINQALVMDKPEKNYTSVSKIFDLIYELYTMAPKTLNGVLPQLECKLKSSSENDRLKSVSLLSKMFSDKDSKLYEEHPQLWKLFMGRFMDISNVVRIKCVQSTMMFLVNHEELRPQIIENLKNRQHDSDETVRYEVVMSIVEATKRDFSVISKCPDLLTFVKERTLDKVFKIRKEALTGLAIIYKKYMSAVQSKEEVDPVIKQAADWIKNKILHGYYMVQAEDRILVERLLITHLVPYQLPADERMKVLYHLLATIDENATKAFIELQKNQSKIRRMIGDWVRLHKQKEMTPAMKKDLAGRCSSISKLLPDPVKAQEFLLKFSLHLRNNPQLLKEMEIILKKDVACKECADTIGQVLKKLGQPVLTNQYFNTIKIMLNRIASLIIDRSGLEILLALNEKCLVADENQNCFQKTKNGNWSDEDDDEEKPKNSNSVIEDLPTSVAAERGLKLLAVLSYIFPAHFQDPEILKKMVDLLAHEKEYVAPNVLKAFCYLGRYKSLMESYPEIVVELAPICKEYVLSGTPKQAKHAIQAMFINTQQHLQQSYNNFSATEDNEKLKKIDIFQEIVESFNQTLNSSNDHYRTAIVSLGHIAYNLPEKYNIQFKNIISRKIVKELLVKDVPEDRDDVPNLDWCEEEELPEDTRCRVEGLKAMARWLLGLKKDVLSAQKTFRMLNAFIKQKGDLLEQNRLSTAEKSWLRLSAGKAMLKICEQCGVGDQFTPDQFYNLSQLMVDEVDEVREIFVRKLHKGLSKAVPPKCLSVEFMGCYVLGGREKNQKILQQIKINIEADVARRRDYIKNFAAGEFSFLLLIGLLEKKICSK
jgi:sister-chromatid-cohesion protein PDS5